MSSLYDLKPKFQEQLRPLADGLARRGVTPNEITVVAIVMSLVTGFLVALFSDQGWVLILLAAVLAVRMALNAIDGMIAREHEKATPAGTMLNEIADVLCDMALYMPLLLVPGYSPLLTALAIVFAVVSEVAGIAALSIGASRRHDGPMGKSDRAAALGLLALLSGIGILPPIAINVALVVVIALGALTVVNRVNGALEEQAKA